jgi:hypothetical protein
MTPTPLFSYLFIFIVIISAIQFAASFSVNIFHGANRWHFTSYPSYLSLSEDGDDRSLQKPSVDFALQELRVQLRTKVTPGMLTPEKKSELESYLRVLGRSLSPIPLRTLNDNNAEKLVGSWRLGFTSDKSSIGSLPRDSNIYLKVYNNFTCDYCIDFGGKIGSLTAKSTFSVSSSGQISFVYKDIVANIFGLKNVPVPLFGLLAGRENFIDTVWFDGNVWIERAVSPSGDMCYNIYTKDGI